MTASKPTPKEQYTYKGFNIVYKIATCTRPNLYRADAYILSSENENPCPQKFHTEHPTAAGARTEIKRLLRNYIDFEWKKFHEMNN
ncbi:MAG: hypothetical protein H2069_01600 [Legionella sp.]|nr:hypothetical protein [Legionella sp.]